MCIPFVPNFPSSMSANLLLRNGDYEGVANLLAIAPDNVDNIQKYHGLAVALLDAKTGSSNVEDIAIEKLVYCAQKGHALSKLILIQRFPNG